MLRDYSTGFKEDVNVFSGIEIEHTPAYGKQTLFLARNDLTFDQIQSLAVAADAEAIYYGANRTYMHSHAMQLAQIHQLLDRGYWVTVDYPFELHQLVAKKFSTCWRKERFIPFWPNAFFFTPPLRNGHLEPVQRAGDRIYYSRRSLREYFDIGMSGFRDSTHCTRVETK